MPRLNRPVWAITVLSLLVLFGVYLTVQSTSKLNELLARQNWSIAEGKIIKSEIIIRGVALPMVIYSFKANGRAYIDTTNLQVPGFGNKAKQYQVAQELVDKYSTGNSITVHYNPDDATESLIIIHPQWNVFGKIGLGVVLFGVALFFLLLPLPIKSIETE